ncbi:MAG: tetratricopeptide repeat protein, partial [Deltaproteobacteria bacterium]|nr:tetratricopeptide repeat protein [Deltaproteobacteria bacterium]
GFEAKDYKKAAEMFLAVVDDDPKNKVADKALQNAAVAYMNLHYYDSAAKVYQRIVADYPQSQYVEGALYQLAENARKFLDFDRAVEGYRSLVTRFPNTKQLQEASFKIAQLTEAQGRVREAAQAYERYVAQWPADADAPALLFRVADMYEKLGSRDEALRIYRQFAGQYRMNSAQNDRVMEAIARQADIHRASGNLKEWEAVARTLIKEFQARAIPAGSPAAVHAAKAQFQLIEPKFKTYEAILFRGDIKSQGKLIQQKRALMGELQQEYALVLPYKSVEWTSAAVFRMALLPELFAKAMFAAEIPPMDPEQEDIYRTQLEDVATQYRTAAQDAYVKVIEENRRLRTSNEWTDRAVEAMNKYRPQEFPLQKQERRVLDPEGGAAAPTFEEAL